MPVITLAEINGVTLSVDIDATEDIVSVTLDPAEATGAVRFRFPADGSRVDVIRRPGDASVSRSFALGQRLKRLRVLTTKPVGGQELAQIAPSWLLEAV